MGARRRRRRQGGDRWRQGTTTATRCAIGAMGALWICCDAIAYNPWQSICARSTIGGRLLVDRLASLGVALSPGRQGQCVKRAIIKHLFSGVLALRSAQFWRCAGADLRRSDHGRLKRSRTRIYSPTHRPPFHRCPVVAPVVALDADRRGWPHATHGAVIFFEFF